VRAISFLENISVTACCLLLHRNVFISFLVVPFLPWIGFVYFLGDVRGTALRVASRAIQLLPPVKLHSSTPRPILRAHGALGEQASGTCVRIETPARVCAGDQVFGECLHDCLPSSSSSERLHLLPGGALSSSDRLRMLPSGRSRDSTMYIFLHRLWLSNSP